jgi:SSS family solute:Na+ symporter
VAGNPPNPQLAVPQLFENEFPSWFAGVGYAAIAIGALVPAAIMSIAAANLFTRNIYRADFRPDATPREEAQVSKIVSLVVKVGALVFVLALSRSFAINLQLLGGVWILQTFPAIVVGLYTRWFHRGALIGGWLAGMVLAFWMLWQIPNAATKHAHFGGSAFPLSKFGFDSTKSIYVGFVAVLVNLAVAAIVTLILRATKTADGGDDTSPEDYTADAADEPARKGDADSEDLAPEPIT